MPSEMLAGIAAYLEDAVPALTAQTNLFAAHMPSSPDECVALYEYSGPAPNETMRADVELPRLHVDVRSTDYASAHDLTRSVYDALNTMADETVSGWAVYTVQPVDSPAMVRWDSNNQLPIFGCNFQVWRRA